MLVPLIEKWPALIVIVLLIIGTPYSIFALFLSELKRQPNVPKDEYFSDSPIIAVTCAWVMLGVCLFDIFVLQTLVITFIAAFISAITTTAVTGYIGYVAKHKYGLIARFNNG